MKVLLIHPEDTLPHQARSAKWDLIVDLARAPLATYERWREISWAPVISLYDFSESIDDLYFTQRTIGREDIHLIDGRGVDWWSLASYLVADGLLETRLLCRLAQKIGKATELVSTRTDARAEVLRRLLDTTLETVDSGGAATRLKHYADVLSRHNRAQLMQVVEDKWDPQHKFRRMFGHRERGRDERVVLLPTAYINISRTAVAYARLLPEQQFLLMYARSSGKLRDLPPNVRLAPLHPYYPARQPQDLTDLLKRWNALKQRLVTESEDFQEANELGAMDGVSEFIRRGVSARDAWNRVYDSHNVVGCLSCDDTNIYTRLPLVLAKLKRIPAVASHHGALDYRMALKTMYSDAYLAKSEMESDYLTNVCRISPEKIEVGGPGQVLAASTIGSPHELPWMVFFTEPYDAESWRKDEVYRELLPELVSLAQQSGLRLVFKLHPFESAKGHRNLLSRWLSAKHCRQIKIVTGGLTPGFWAQVRFAITVQSSVALECTRLGIPVFLCGWLGSRYGGYIQQFAKFGAGQLLARCEDLRTVPERLAGYVIDSDVQRKLGTAIDPAVLRHRLGVKGGRQIQEPLGVL